MRISVTYLYAIFRYGYPHSVDDALRSVSGVRKLGFRFLEMEGLGAEMMAGLHKRKAELLRVLGEEDVHVHNFCVVDPQLVSLDGGSRRQALDGFRLGAELAAAMGAETLHLASYAPPVEYVSRRPYELGGAAAYEFGDRFALRLPPGFDWNEVWRALVSSVRECADIAAGYGKTVIMEPRVGEVICSVDSLLRLIEHVDRPNFQANFDTGHFSAQRENAVLALAKLRGKFANIHISDNDPANADHLPIGDGSIDWLEFFRVLRDTGYAGYLGLDLGMTETLAADYQRSVDRLRAIGSELGIVFEV
jgi:sugar phosphate isomerase/epimerase